MQDTLLEIAYMYYSKIFPSWFNDIALPINGVACYKKHEVSLTAINVQHLCYLNVSNNLKVVVLDIVYCLRTYREFFRGLMVYLKVKIGRSRLQLHPPSFVSCSTNVPPILITIVPPLGLNKTINLVYIIISSLLLMLTPAHGNLDWGSTRGLMQREISILIMWGIAKLVSFTQSLGHM